MINNKVLLGVNIDHVATLRQARHTYYPNIVEAMFAAKNGGADSITIHLREDRRHIQEEDVVYLKQLTPLPLNLEMAVTTEMLDFAQKIQPTYCCLVPEKREELTTEGGLDIIKYKVEIKNTCDALSDSGIRVSLFIDPEFPHIEQAFACGAQAIELHTGFYANLQNSNELMLAYNRLKQACEYAHSLGLTVNAGHGLNYTNVSLIAALPHCNELNIGHSIISRAIFVGLEQAVREMKELIRKGVPSND